MPDSPAEKRRAVARLRRIRGQALALELGITDGRSCADVLQQLAAMRGAIEGLMTTVLEGHLRETFTPSSAPASAAAKAKARVATPPVDKVDQTVALVRAYLR